MEAIRGEAQCVHVHETQVHLHVNEPTSHAHEPTSRAHEHIVLLLYYLKHHDHDHHLQHEFISIVDCIGVVAEQTIGRDGGDYYCFYQGELQQFDKSYLNDKCQQDGWLVVADRGWVG